MSLELSCGEHTRCDREQASDSGVVPAHQTKDSSIDERIADAKDLVQQVCRRLGEESVGASYELRLARALAMNLLDELGILESARPKK